MTRFQFHHLTHWLGTYATSTSASFKENSSFEFLSSAAPVFVLSFFPNTLSQMPRLSSRSGRPMSSLSWRCFSLPAASARTDSVIVVEGVARHCWLEVCEHALSQLQEAAPAALHSQIRVTFFQIGLQVRSKMSNDSAGEPSSLATNLTRRPCNIRHERSLEDKRSPAPRLDHL
jgi:hypothetical protein